MVAAAADGNSHIISYQDPRSAAAVTQGQKSSSATSFFGPWTEWDEDKGAESSLKRRQLFTKGERASTGFVIVEV